MNKKNKKIIFFAVMSVFVIISIIFSVIILTVKKYVKELPTVESLQDYKPNLATEIYDINNKLIDEFFVEKRTYVNYKDIPQDLINAIIATEDNNFYEHWGISPLGIIRAFLTNIVSFRLSQGGSTITQQLAKLMFLTREKKLSRKIKEAILSIRLEMQYSKSEILTMYLNHIYLAHGIYGVSLASEFYFGKKLDELGLEEIALIAGLPKAPESYSPFKNEKLAKQRRDTVLSRMLKMKFITKEKYEEAINKPIVVTEKAKRQRYASYFVEQIRIELEKKYGDMLYKGGLKIYTTLDIDMQMAAVNAIENNLSKFDELKKERIKKYLDNHEKWNSDFNKYKDIDDYEDIQGALIALDVKTGQIRALVGGRDFKKSQFNRVFQAKRQAGSSFKPIIYTAAIDQGVPPNFILEDEPVVYYNNGDWKLVGHKEDLSDVPQEIINKLKKNPNKFDKSNKYDPLQLWTPKNYSRKYYGNITLRKALEKSLNIASIKLLEKVTPKVALVYAKKMGIDSIISPYLSMVLGSFEVTPLEITKAYNTIANYGVKTEPYMIIKVCDNSGQVLEEHFPKEEIVLPEKTAYIMTNLLRGVVLHGTARVATRVGVPVAAKTGTTNDSSDTWFIGYSPDIVATVWVGYDKLQSIGSNQTGANLSGPIWSDFMLEALKYKGYKDFRVPDDIVFVPIDKKTGLKALELNEDSYSEAFVKGTEPDDFSVYSDLFEKDFQDEKEVSEEVYLDDNDSH
jgi:penicillin-binding protein 1A